MELFAVTELGGLLAAGLVMIEADEHGAHLLFDVPGLSAAALAPLVSHGLLTRLSDDAGSARDSLARPASVETSTPEPL